MRTKLIYKPILCVLAACSLSAVSLAQEAETAAPAVEEVFDGVAWGMITLLLFIFFSLVYLIANIRTIRKEERPAFSFKTWWAAMDAKMFTKAIPIEKEADHLLDHDYDGIKELDNSLPPWWKWGFYVTIVVGVVYMLRFHVFNTGPTPEQEYNTEMAFAEMQIEEYRKKVGDMVDEKTVTMADASGISEGQKIFQTACMACHGAKGEGGVGPNLADNYWLHGGSINDVFKTIKYGVTDKGMQAWEKTYSPAQIKNIASYIKTLAGTNPANGKVPQGEPYEEESANTAAKDSTATVKK
jgi:cytochrome c oxidase cbb3-type subunit 3